MAYDCGFLRMRRIAEADGAFLRIRLAEYRLKDLGLSLPHLRVGAELRQHEGRGEVADDIARLHQRRPLARENSDPAAVAIEPRRMREQARRMIIERFGENPRDTHRMQMHQHL